VFAFDAAIAHLIAAAVGGYVCVDLLFAGSSARLANVDYAAVADPAALNRWAAIRLLMVPAAAGVNAVLAGIQWLPDAWLWTGFAAAVCGTAAWVGLGARRFRSNGPAERNRASLR
jgi:hypothetical protein